MCARVLSDPLHTLLHEPADLLELRCRGRGDPFKHGGLGRGHNRPSLSQPAQSHLVIDHVAACDRVGSHIHAKSGRQQVESCILYANMRLDARQQHFRAGVPVKRVHHGRYGEQLKATLSRRSGRRRASSGTVGPSPRRILFGSLHRHFEEPGASPRETRCSGLRPRHKVPSPSVCPEHRSPVGLYRPRTSAWDGASLGFRKWLGSSRMLSALSKAVKQAGSRAAQKSLFTASARVTMGGSPFRSPAVRPWFSRSLP